MTDDADREPDAEREPDADREPDRADTDGADTGTGNTGTGNTDTGNTGNTDNDTDNDTDSADDSGDPAVPPAARGPDPDHPPWAGRESDEPDEPGGGDGAGRRAASDRDASDRDASEEPARDGQPEGGPPRPQTRHGGQLAELGDAPRPPRPPKRTGVFLDPDDLREHVGGLLRVVLGGYEVDAWGNFTFSHEDARIFVTVRPTPIGPTVGVFSVTNLEVELTPRLAGFLLTTNHQLGFGAFSYDPDNEAVWLRHTLLGTTLDGPELQSAVAAVAATAARFDDEIQQRFGGRTFHDAPADVQDAARPPEPEEPSTPPNAGGYL